MEAVSALLVMSGSSLAALPGLLWPLSELLAPLPCPLPMQTPACRVECWAGVPLPVNSVGFITTKRYNWPSLHTQMYLNLLWYDFITHISVMILTSWHNCGKTKACNASSPSLRPHNSESKRLKTAFLIHELETAASPIHKSHLTLFSDSPPRSPAPYVAVEHLFSHGPWYSGLPLSLYDPKGGKSTLHCTDLRIFLLGRRLCVLYFWAVNSSKSALGLQYW